MRSRARVWKLLGCSFFLVVACKERSGAQDSRPLPAPEPPASATPTTVRDEPAKKRPVADAPPEPAKPKRPATEASEPQPASGGAAAATGGAASGGSVSGSGGNAPVASSPTPVMPSSLPGLTAPSAACLSRCQTAMQGCLSQPVDGGVPGFGNLDLCKKAFEACQASCK